MVVLGQGQKRSRFLLLESPHLSWLAPAFRLLLLCLAAVYTSLARFVFQMSASKAESRDKWVYPVHVRILAMVFIGDFRTGFLGIKKPTTTNCIGLIQGFPIGVR